MKSEVSPGKRALLFQTGHSRKMDPRTKVYSLGNCSSFRNAGTPESQEVQYELLHSFDKELDSSKPEGAIIGERTPLNRAWTVRVGFQNKETETDTYRRKIKTRFPHAEVKNVDGGDEWMVPFADGIDSGQSKCVTFLFVIFILAIGSGVSWLIFGPQ